MPVTVTHCLAPQPQDFPASWGHSPGGAGAQCRCLPAGGLGPDGPGEGL